MSLLTSFSITLSICGFFLVLKRKKFAFILYIWMVIFFPFYWKPVHLPYFNDVTIPETLSIGLALGLLIEILLYIKKTKDLPKSWVYEFFLVLVLFVWQISFFEETTFSNWVRTIIISLLDYWVPFALAIRLYHEQKNIKDILKPFIFPTALLGIIVITEFIRQEPLVWDFFNSIFDYRAKMGFTLMDGLWEPVLVSGGLLRVQASFGQPIFLGYFLTMQVIILLYFLSEKTKWNITLLIVFGETLLAAFLPLCRGSILTLAISFALLWFAGKSHARSTINRMLIAGIIFFLIALPVLSVSTLSNTRYLNYWADFTGSILGKVDSATQAQQLKNLQYRQDILAQGISLINKAPLFGFGDLSLNGAKPIYDVVIVFLQVGIKSGWLGLIVFLGWMAKLLTNNISSMVKDSTGDGHILFILLFVILMSWMGSSWPGQFVQVSMLILGVIGAYQPLEHAAFVHPIKVIEQPVFS